MRFKDFIKLSEEQSSTDKGMMGFGVQPLHKPSDGQPFSKYTKSTAGAGYDGGSSGGAAPQAGASPMFMKKKMKKV
jgi:hypothetical protein